MLELTIIYSSTCGSSPTLALFVRFVWIDI